jgi:hypothetical protein
MKSSILAGAKNSNINHSNMYLAGGNQHNTTNITNVLESNHGAGKFAVMDRIRLTITDELLRRQNASEHRQMALLPQLQRVSARISTKSTTWDGELAARVTCVQKLV